MNTDTQRPLPGFFGILGFAVFNLVMIASLLEFASWTIWSAQHRGPYPFEDQAASPVYAGDLRAPEYWHEESQRFRWHRPYVPYRVWGVTEWHGKYMNADVGDMGILRRTINPSDDQCQDKPRSIIWVFGGSTVYGQFVPDWATLPSYLSHILNSAAGGGCVIVRNLGVEGYVTNQELILLVEQLKKGRRPDVVIFYDGVNDAGAASETPDPAHWHGTLAVIKGRVEGSLSARLDFLRESYTGRLTGELLRHLRKVRGSPSSGADARAAAVLDNYEANMQLAGALSKTYNFKLLRFWQPTLVYGHKPLVPFEQQIVRQDESKDSPYASWFQTASAVYREAESRAAKGSGFVFLGSVFDSTKEPVYIDEAHLGPLGNELAAQAVAKYMEDHPAH